MAPLRDTPFDPYIGRMRNDLHARKLEADISEAMHKDSPRFRRATRFADLMQYLLAEFLPTERNCRHFIHRRLVEAGFAGNCEILNVPPECDELDRLMLERRMIEAKITPVTLTAGYEPDCPRCRRKPEMSWNYCANCGWAFEREARQVARATPSANPALGAE